MHPRAPLATGAAIALAALLLHQPAGAAVEPPPPATGHAEVIAQGIVTFGDGPSHWQLTVAPATETDSAIDTTAPTFVVADGPAAVVVSGPTGPVARLAEGEAIFRAGGEPTLLRTASGPTGEGAAVSIVAGPGDPGVTFDPGPGARDVDLVRDVLNINEVLVLHTDVSVFVVVTAGTVSADGTNVPAGSTATLSGDVALINTAPEVAVVAVVVIGPLLDGADTTTPTTQPPAPSPGTNPSGAGSDEPAGSEQHHDHHDHHGALPIPTPTATVSPMTTRRSSAATPTASTPTVTG